jgi:tRNA/tmRNA/rRNA uracil-C5-methylase (TrmA/RlmC/RlmD family)
VEEVRPSPHKVSPHCTKYFGICGGCKNQNLLYQEQLKQKQYRVEDLFDDVKKQSEIQIRSIIGVEKESYHYRNKMEFSCSAGRWLLDKDKRSSSANNRPDFTLGFFPSASSSVRRSRRKRWNPRILSIDECALQDPLFDDILNFIRKRCEQEEIKAFDFEKNTGFLKSLTLRQGKSHLKGKEVLIGFTTTKLNCVQSVKLSQIASELLTHFNGSSNIVSIVQRLDDDAYRQLIKRSESNSDPPLKTKVLHGDDVFHDSILGRVFQISLESFFQPNTSQAEVLYEQVQVAVSTIMKERGLKPIIWDLFCGVGSIGICMAELAKKVYGFEIVKTAIEKATLNASLNGYDSSQMEFFCLDLTQKWGIHQDFEFEIQGGPAGFQENLRWRQYLKSDKADEDASEKKKVTLEYPDIVIVDPPRAGLHPKLIKFLQRLGAPHIVYVSCNPLTQARDLTLLSEVKLDEIDDNDVRALYQSVYLQPVDMMPHTPHVETVVLLQRVY